MDKAQCLIELWKLMDEYADEIEQGNDKHADAYQAVGFAIHCVEEIRCSQS